MTLITKYAKYGAAVVASLAVAVALLVGSTPRTAHASAPATVTATAPVQAAGLTENWTVTVVASAASAITTHTLTFPTGFTLPSASSAYAMVDKTAATVTVSSVALTGTNVVLITHASNSACDGTGCVFTITGVVNGSDAAANLTAASSLDTTTTAGAANIWTVTATRSPASVPADGASTSLITITPSRAAGNSGGGLMTVSTSSGRFLATPAPSNGTIWNAAGAVSTDGLTVSNSVQASVATTTAETMSLQAPTSAGSATITVRVTPQTGGTAVLLSATSVTFTTATAVAGAPASVTVAPAATTVANNAAQNSVITVLDAAGAQVLNGTTVTVTTSNGTFTTCPGGTTGSGVCNTTVQSAGAVTVGITGSSVSGTQTITATAGSATGTATVTLTGTTAGSVSVAIRAADPTSTTGGASTTAGATTPAPCGAFNSSTCRQNVLTTTVKDAAGNNAPGITVTYSVSPSDGQVSFVTAGSDTAATTATSSSTASILGQARLALKVATTAVPGTVYTITASAPTTTGTTTNSLTVTIGDTFSASSTAATVTVTAPDVAVNGVSTITVDVLGLNGKAVGDGTSVTLVTSAGAVANITNGQPTGPNPAFTVNGKASFTFVAPSTAGSVNATALISTRTTSKTFSVGGTTPTTPPTTTGGSFSGGTIAASGVSIVSFTGTTAQLNTAGAAAKLVSVTATVGGKMLTFVVGAPDFVNAEFNAAFPNGLSGTLVIVKA